MRLMLLILLATLGLSEAVMAEISQKAYERTTEQLSQVIAASQALDQQVVAYDAVFRRNPLRPLVDAQGQLVTSVGLRDGLSVQGVIWSQDHPFAVIDEELVAPGAIVGPYTILQIQSDGVIVKRGEEILTIPLDRGLEPLDASPIPAEPSVFTPAIEPPAPAPAEVAGPSADTATRESVVPSEATSDQETASPAEPPSAEAP